MTSERGLMHHLAKAVRIPSDELKLCSLIVETLQHCFAGVVESIS